MPDAVHWTDYAIPTMSNLVHRKYKSIISIVKVFSQKMLFTYYIS